MSKVKNIFVFGHESDSYEKKLIGVKQWSKDKLNAVR